MVENNENSTEVVQATSQLVEQPVNSETPAPDKKEKGNGGGTTLAIIFGVMLVIGFIFLGDFYNYILDYIPDELKSYFNLTKYVESKKLNKVDESSVEENKTDTTTTTKKTNYKIGGVYESYKKTEGEDDNGYLSIRSDGTFVYDESTRECFDPLVGTYTIDDNIITFNVKVSYSCDSCYNKNVSDSFKATIYDENTLTIESKYMGAIISNEYRKNSSKVESNSKKAFYSIEPVNGTKSEESNETWLSCE
jgi:hypothetical protein